MDLVLTASKTIGELNREFQKQFPYLKLEFYTQHQDGYHSVETAFPSGITFGKIAPNFTFGAIKINADDTVAKLERYFLTNFGLHVKVLRKDGYTWTEIINTDHLELQKQNSIGIRTSKPYRVNINTLFL